MAMEREMASGDRPADLSALRLAQARLLHSRTLTSCLIVEGVIIYLAALMIFAGDPAYAALWFSLTSLLVVMVALYPRMAAPRGINAATAPAYLRGHAVVSGLTGLVWSGLAIGYLDDTSVLHMFITLNMVVSISIGGMLPSAEYRPTFLSLLTAMVIPFAAHWLIVVEGPLRLIGVGLLIYYGFGVLVSERAERQTREALAAERQRKLSEALQAKTAELEQANFAKSRLLAATSHDMAQPLQAQGFLMTALRAYLDKPRQTELLDRIEAAWRTQKELLDAVVESARVEGGAVQVRNRAVAIDALLTETAALFQAEAEGRRLSLSVHRSGHSALTDPAVLSRVLRNLTGNAVKFTPPEGRVELWSRRDGEDLVVEVIDTGPGVPDEDRARIFNAFVQLEPNRGEGLGLGLSIVEHLAAALKAPLHFESTPGVGTRAGVTLKLVEDRSTSVASEPTIPQAASMRIQGAPLVLVIEDDAAVRDGLSLLLTEWGCRVLAAESGARAVAMVRLVAEAPAFAIVDKRLGAGESGMDALAEVRNEAGALVPAVLLTGDVSGFDTVRAAGGLKVLTKPADPAALRALIVAALKAPA